MSNYRVLVHYDPDRSVYVARAPELEHCSAEGATRAEALTKIEEEIDAQLRNMREHGHAPPASVDDATAQIGGDVTVKLSRTLHRDLLWQARLEGIELGQLVAEMLAAGLEIRRATRRRAPSSQPPQERADTRDSDAQPQRNTGNSGNDRRPFRQGGGQGGGGRYHAIMEDRATFLEYVRGLESGGGRGPGGGGGGGGGGPGGGAGSRRRSRGRSGPGGGQGEGGGGGGGTPDGEGPK